MRRFKTIEEVELALSEAQSSDEVQIIHERFRRQKKLLGPRHTASDPTSNRRRYVAALNAASERLSNG